MKRLLILIAGVAVFAAGVSFGVARWMTARAPRPTASDLHNLTWLKRELHLTEAQAREIENLERAFRGRLNAACTAHCDARMALGDELAKAKPDLERCHDWVEKMNAVQAESERATLEQILRVRALLTDQQAQRYSALIRDQVCNMPMGAP